jgi:hypothetical protein
MPEAQHQARPGADAVLMRGCPSVLASTVPTPMPTKDRPI